MRLLAPAAFVVVLVALVSSCGTDEPEDRLLRLPGDELTESELRARWREQLASAPAAASMICQTIVGAEPDVVLSFFALDVDSGALDEATLADVRRAAEILGEECSSGSPGEP